jgi:hypothetical protein
VLTKNLRTKFMAAAKNFPNMKHLPTLLFYVLEFSRLLFFVSFLTIRTAALLTFEFFEIVIFFVFFFFASACKLIKISIKNKLIS